MKRNRIIVGWLILLALSLFNFQPSTAQAQGTAFTYQGRLNDSNGPVNGYYDMQFAIYDAASAGTQQGNVLTNTATAVSNGLFTVTLDFGDQFTGAACWLEIAVQTNGGSGFSTLSPRQPLTPAPYAIYAGNAGSVSAANISGTLSPAQLPAGVVTNNETGVTVSGTFNGNGSGLTSLNAANLSGIIGAGQLPSVVLTNGASGVSITGTFSGNGAGVSNVNLQNVNSEGAISWMPITWSNFVFSSTLTVGNWPGCVVAADVNGDGLVDLISADSGTNTLTVLTNDGRGGFVLSSTLTVGSGPACVVAVDINGDGKVDLISADYNTNTLTVLTNDGHGGFALCCTLTVGNGPDSLVAADVNGDGKPDLICGNQGDGTLTVLTNDGRGGFVVASTPSLGGGYPNCVVAADVNGDGKPDLICVNLGSYPLTVLTNAGSGNFIIASRPRLTFPIRPWSVAAADVNGDGYVDLITADGKIGGDGDTLSVLTNDGSGNFTVSSTLTVGNGPYSVTAADVNGDGLVDLISANSSDNTLTVLTNNGSGGFVLSSTLNVGNYPNCVVAADVNGDGLVDLISANSGTNTLTVLTNTPSSGFIPNFSGNGAGLTSLNAANLTGTISASLLPALDATNITSGTLALAQLPAAVVTNTESGVAFSGDFNGVFSGNGSGLTNLPITLPAGLLTNHQSGVVLNGLDVTSNLFVGETNFANYLVVTNPPWLNGSGITNLNAAALTGTVSLAQLPGVVLTNGASGVNMAGTFSGNGVGMSNVNLMNVNSDGAITWASKASGNFVLASSPAVGPSPEAVIAADLTGDGSLDLVTVNSGNNTLTVLTNNGSGAFALSCTLNVGNNPQSVVAADVNGDGKLDLISGNYNDGTVTVLTNMDWAASCFLPRWPRAAALIVSWRRMSMAMATWI